jgi:prepilin-type N-terminal cleavage/methylation domain-containing protein
MPSSPVVRGRRVLNQFAMKIQTSKRTGFTLVEIMIVIAIIGLLAGVAVPNFLKATKTAKRRACLMNIEQIENAKQLWATEYKKSDEDTPSEDDVKAYLKGNKMPQCPEGGTYSINAVKSPATCTKHAEDAP